jgi:N-acetylmuramoyl-L-alanine amidase
MPRLLGTLFVLLLTSIAFCQLRGKVICLDPGHPSEVGRGTQGKKLTEIQVAWRMALLVKSKLQAMGAKVVLTKTSEGQFVRNRARAEAANQAHADFMLRLHCDAAAGSGFTTYYPTQQGTAGGKTGPDPDLLTRTKPIAERFHVAFAKAMKGKLPDLGLKSDLKTAVGARQGALTGSIFSIVPVVLVEMVVLTNPKDEAFIANKANQNSYAKALCAGVIAAVRN